MSVKINLLPDIHQAKLRARYLRQLSAAITVLLSGVAVVFVVVMFLITTAQALQISSLTKKIADNQSQLSGKSDLEEIVTLQQHLDSLPGLYSDRPSFLAFLKVLESITPGEIAFSNVDVRDRSEFKATGISKSMATVDKLDKAMEASKGEKNTNNFSAVNVSIESQDTTGVITFDMTATVSPEVTHGSN